MAQADRAARLYDVAAALEPPRPKGGERLLDVVRAGDFLMSLPQADTARYLVQGSSQGGGLALVAALLNAATGFCLGCELYLSLRRVLPRTA